MEIVYSKEEYWLQQWDDYILTENRGSHLLLSDWNKSFRSYGFDFEVCICLEEAKIVGGFVAVIAKAFFFRFFIIPYGPIVSVGHEDKLNELISAVSVRAKFHNCCYCHITLPFSVIPNKHLFTSLPKLPVLNNAAEGHKFKYVYSSNGLNWVNVTKADDEESLLNSFRASVRRYIRSSERKELTLKFLKTETDIKAAYELCLENAKNNNYSLRDWDSFKETLMNMTAKGNANFLGAFHEENIKGASLIIKSGNYITYILGGTKKEKPDYLAGHFLHWQGIKIAFKEGLDGYNISLGGSKGVLLLKNSYADEQLFFENSKYHWVLKPFYFKIYLFLEKVMKKNKKSVSKILSILKRK